MIRKYMNIYILGLVDIGIGCLLMQNYFSINISCTIVKLKSTSSKSKISFTKVAPNDPSYCSNFFLF